MTPYLFPVWRHWRHLLSRQWHCFDNNHEVIAAHGCSLEKHWSNLRDIVHQAGRLRNFLGIMGKEALSDVIFENKNASNLSNFPTLTSNIFLTKLIGTRKQFGNKLKSLRCFISTLPIFLVGYKMVSLSQNETLFFVVDFLFGRERLFCKSLPSFALLSSSSTENAPSFVVPSSLSSSFTVTSGRSAERVEDVTEPHEGLCMDA